MYVASAVDSRYPKHQYDNEVIWCKDNEKYIKLCMEQQELKECKKDRWLQKYIRVGHFTIGCDHSCYHGGPSAMAVSGECCEGGAELTTARTDAVVKVCTEQIKRADIVVGLITKGDQYGTFAELAYAYGLKKPVLVFYNPELGEEEIAEMWFLTSMSRQSIRNTTTYNINKHKQLVTNFTNYIESIPSKSIYKNYDVKFKGECPELRFDKEKMRRGWEVAVNNFL